MSDTAPYLDGCPQLPSYLSYLLDDRKKNRPVNLLHRIVLALHLRDCKESIRNAREAYERETGHEVSVEPPQL